MHHVPLRTWVPITGDYDEMPLGSVLSDDDVIYLVEERFFDEEDMFPVYYKSQEFGRVGWKIRVDIWDNNCSDNARSLKLRIQEELGFPVSFINVKFRGNSIQNIEKLRHKNVNKKLTSELKWLESVHHFVDF